MYSTRLQHAAFYYLGDSLEGSEVIVRVFFCGVSVYVSALDNIIINVKSDVVG